MIIQIFYTLNPTQRQAIWKLKKSHDRDGKPNNLPTKKSAKVHQKNCTCYLANSKQTKMSGAEVLWQDSGVPRYFQPATLCPRPWRAHVRDVSRVSQKNPSWERSQVWWRINYKGQTWPQGRWRKVHPWPQAIGWLFWNFVFLLGFIAKNHKFSMLP